MLREVILPTRTGRILGGEDIVGAACDRGHQGQGAAVTAHDLDDKRALVGGRRAGQLVDRVHDAVQRGVSADRHVGAHHVVVDRSDQTNDDEIRVGESILLRNDALISELSNVLPPLASKLVRSRQGSVAADHNEVVDPVFEEVGRGAVAPLVGAEVRATGCADDRTAFGEDGGHVRPFHSLDGVASVACPLPSFEDGVGLRAPGQRRSHNPANGRVHSLGVSAGCEDSDAHSAHFSAIFH